MSGVIALLTVIIVCTVCVCVSSILYCFRVRLKFGRAFATFSYFFAFSLFSAYFVREFFNVCPIADKLISSNATAEMRVFIGLGLGAQCSDIARLIFVLAAAFGSVAVCIRIIFSVVSRVLPRMRDKIKACVSERKGEMLVRPFMQVCEKSNS